MLPKDEQEPTQLPEVAQLQFVAPQVTALAINVQLSPDVLLTISKAPAALDRTRFPRSTLLIVIGEFVRVVILNKAVPL